MLPIPVARIVRLHAQGDYVRVHTPEQSYLLHLSLSALEARLDPGRFLRIHRSHLVNLDHVREMRPLDERRLLVCLTDGSTVAASRTGSQRLRELIH